MSKNHVPFFLVYNAKYKEKNANQEIAQNPPTQTSLSAFRTQQTTQDSLAYNDCLHPLSTRIPNLNLKKCPGWVCDC